MSDSTQCTFIIWRQSGSERRSIAGSGFWICSYGASRPCVCPFFFPAPVWGLQWAYTFLLYLDTYLNSAGYRIKNNRYGTVNHKCKKKLTLLYCEWVGKEGWRFSFRMHCNKYIGFLYYVFVSFFYFVNGRYGFNGCVRKYKPNSYPGTRWAGWSRHEARTFVETLGLNTPKRCEQ